MQLDRYRPLIACVFFGILAIANLAYVFAYSNGSVADFSAKWDMPQVKILNLLLVIALVAVGFVKPKVEDDS